MAVTQVFKMLTSSDARLVAVARGRLAALTGKIGRSSEVSASDMASFLSGGPVCGRSDRAGAELERGLLTYVRGAAPRLGVRFIANADGLLSVTSDGKMLTSQSRRIFTRSLHLAQINGGETSGQPSLIVVRPLLPIPFTHTLTIG